MKTVAFSLCVMLAQPGRASPQTPQAPQAPQAPQTPQTPQTPQAPGSSSQQSTTVVVPPPPGQAPIYLAPQEQPVQVAPCPPARTRVVYRSTVVGEVVRGAFLGGAAGLAFGGLVGLASGHDTWSQYRVDIGAGAAVGFALGGVAGGVLAYYDRQEAHPDGVARVLTNRPGRTVVALGGRF